MLFFSNKAQNDSTMTIILMYQYKHYVLSEQDQSLTESFPLVSTVRLSFVPPSKVNEQGVVVFQTLLLSSGHFKLGAIRQPSYHCTPLENAFIFSSAFFFK